MDIKEEIKDEFYMSHLRKIKKTYEESKDWYKVISKVVYVYSNILEAQEAFIDYVEEVYKTKVKDAKHLQKLTGEKDTPLEVLEGTVLACRYSKYFRVLKKALWVGARYKDLLQIKPQDFGLPKTWSLPKTLSLHKPLRGDLLDQYSSILWAISSVFLIDRPLVLLPSLRIIAEEIEAPYSVLMDSYKLANR